ncbi:hypothetical protein LguiB_003479 [Lonicera macranthoides]
MEGGIDSDAPLDYAEFQFFSSHNRYEVCACSGNNVETVASGLLEQLLLNSSEVRNLHSKGANASFKIQQPGNLSGAEWFTKSILTRFLRIVGSPDIFNITNAIENEISQLEETRRFQLSLNVTVEVDTVTSDESKNELLRAMDLRLTALRGELVGAFNRAAGASCSRKEISDLAKFSHHFGAINIRNVLHKFVELSQQGQPADFPSDSKFIFTMDSRNGKVNRREENTCITKPSNMDTPVKYGVSPAKAAQVERQSSTESEESSFSSEEDRPSVERSRTLIRSASPRRSASPMRRIQIGRSGSRRASALTIKSLNIFPARERAVPHRDATGNSSEEEGSEQPPRKSEINVQRISVQDAISLFESKQRDQTGDVQKTKSSLNASIGANKSVLRRWSSGMGESSVHGLVDNVSESSDPVTPNNLAGVKNLNTSQDVRPNSDVNSEYHSNVETAEVDVKSDSSEEEEEEASYPAGIEVHAQETQREESADKITASAEWSRQKEAELNQLLMKMMESKPVKYRNVAQSDNSKSKKNVVGEQRGGFYDHYKQKRDEKLRGEVPGKRAEKEAQFRAMQKFLDERKAEMAPANTNDVAKRQAAVKPQKSQKNLTQSTIPKKELKPAVVKKASSKASPLPATRKSWPSTPSPRTTGTSPAKTPVGPTSTGTTPTRRKPQPASSVPRSSPKIERTQPRPKTVKPTQNDTNKSIKGLTEKKQQTLSKTGKITKSKVQTTAEDQSSMAKPSFYSKVTKRSSVVPLESKPFLRKGSRIGPGVGPVVVKTKASSQSEESLRKADILIIHGEENQVDANTSVMVNQQQERDIEVLEITADLESEAQAVSPQKCEDTGNPNQVTASGDDSYDRVMESGIKAEAEELTMISPSAWGEIEEYQDQPIPCEDSPHQIASAANIVPAGPSSPRVRHSLSQMLLEESSEPEIIEWGNAENPPAMVYQKDAPKGLKRLLKFARKNKADTHSTGWSSPSAFSEGEDEAEEAKASRKNADNLLRKAALNSNNYGQQKTTLYEAYEKNSVQSNISKFSAQNAHKLQEDIASPTAAKARSFFSLSAFRGNKPNETKLR